MMAFPEVFFGGESLNYLGTKKVKLVVLNLAPVLQ
jgi:hypothetical protein